MANCNEIMIGTCGNCGGEVVLPISYMSTRKPVPRCERCGATAATRGPVIPMNPAPEKSGWTHPANNHNQ